MTKVCRRQVEQQPTWPFEHVWKYGDSLSAKVRGPTRLWFFSSVQTLQSLTVLRTGATEYACSWNCLCIILFVHIHCIPFYLTPYGHQAWREKCKRGLVKQASWLRNVLKASNHSSGAGCQPQCSSTGGDASTLLVNTAFCVNVHLSRIRLKHACASVHASEMSRVNSSLHLAKRRQ